MIRTYGNTNLPEETPESPLVTFALLAYNQEKYIREAVEGAFCQTYSPLEIILSDDCSSDRTFEIMEVMAAAYTGPHIIRLRQNTENIGIARHLNAITKEFSGRYLILAAGDDISVAERTAACVAAMEDLGMPLVHSMVTYIDEKSKDTAYQRTHAPLLWAPIDASSAATSTSLYIGATGAISRDLHAKFGQILFPQAYEDLVFGFRSVIGGGSHFIEQRLVRYRIGVGVSHIQPNLSNKEKKEKDKRGLKAHADVYRQRLLDLDAVGGDYEKVRALLSERLHESELRIARRDGVSALFFACIRRPSLSLKIIVKKIRLSRTPNNS